MSKTPFKNVGKLIKAYRLKAGVSQGDLASVFGFANGQAISNTERGIAPFPYQRYKLLCEVLNIPPKKFIRAYMKDDMLRKFGVAA